MNPASNGRKTTSRGTSRKLKQTAEPRVRGNARSSRVVDSGGPGNPSGILNSDIAADDDGAERSFSSVHGLLDTETGIALSVLHSSTRIQEGDERKENASLRKQIELFEVQVENFASENEKLRSDNAELRRAISLSKSAQSTGVARCATQSKEIKLLKQQIEEMNRNAEVVVRDGNEIIQRERERFEQELSEVNKELEEALAEISRRTRELAKLRGVAMQLVNQHTDVETYLHEALTYVRNQLATCPSPPDSKAKVTLPLLFQSKDARAATFSTGMNVFNKSSNSPTHSTASARANGREERRNDTRGGGGRQKGERNGVLAISDGTSPSQMPLTIRESTDHKRGSRVPDESITASQLPASFNLQDVSVVDVRQLTWPDMERVLHLLFQRINHAGGVKGSRALQVSSTFTADPLQKSARRRKQRKAREKAYESIGPAIHESMDEAPAASEEWHDMLNANPSVFLTQDAEVESTQRTRSTKKKEAVLFLEDRVRQTPTPGPDATTLPGSKRRKA